MAEEKKVILTREGYQKLEQELNYYISVRRNEISEQIAIARGFGDLSENAEYDEAKIVEMENTLRNCIVVEDRWKQRSDKYDLLRKWQAHPGR